MFERAACLLTIALAFALAGCPRKDPASARDNSRGMTPAETGMTDLQTPPRPARSMAAPTRRQRCRAARAKFKAEQSRLNRCQRDDDCAELYPGPCPGGPYYVHRKSDLTRLDALRKALNQHCTGGRCRKPPRLGIASCRAGRCVRGRKPPVSTKAESCWDYRETYLELGQRIHTYTQVHQKGITPRHALGVGQAGTLEVLVDWQKDCVDCKLQISEHNSGMANLKQGKRTRKGGRERILLPVTKGLYYFLGREPKSQRGFNLEVRLKTTDGKPAKATHHGDSWQRRCEG